MFEQAVYSAHPELPNNLLIQAFALKDGQREALHFLTNLNVPSRDAAVLPDGLDQLPSREILFTVILTLVIREEVCNMA